MSELYNLSIISDFRNIRVFLNQAQNVLEDLSIGEQKSAAEQILPGIRKLLKNNNLGVNNLSFISYIFDAGSLSGLRVINSLVRGLARAEEIPVIGISRFEIIRRDRKIKDNTLVITEYNRVKVLVKKFGPLPETGILSDPRVIKTTGLPELIKSEKIKTVLTNKNLGPTLIKAGLLNRSNTIYASDNEHDYFIRRSVKLFQTGRSPNNLPRYPKTLDLNKKKLANHKGHNVT